MAVPLPRLIKKRPYIDYSKFSDQIPTILGRLINTKRGDLQKVSSETGIPYSTISRWHQQLAKNTKFNPLNRKWGEHKRIFTDYEEDSIADFILENYIKKGLYFTDDDFREIALAAWREKYLPLLDSEDENIRKEFKEFHCSAGFIADFKYHHRFSSKVFHIKRRADPNNEKEQKFMSEMKQIFETIPHSHIINADETGWKLFPKGILAWGETGVDNVTREGTINDKSQVTIIASIAADRTKLPLLFIAQGKTSQVEESQIGDVGFHWKTHTESGWVNNQAFSFYLHKLREYFDDNEPIHLLMDLYPAHMTPDIRREADELNIVFHIIPAGLTDFYQPLDRKIFGILKAKARKFFRMRHNGDQELKATKKEACEDIVAAWEGLGSYYVGSAWKIYVEDIDMIPDEIARKRREEQERETMSHHRKYRKSLIRMHVKEKVETHDELGYKDIQLD